MSTIKRYDWDDYYMAESPIGRYVLASDHDAALETAENIAAGLRNDMRDAQKQLVALEGKLTRAEGVLRELNDFVVGTDERIGILDTTDGYYEWSKETDDLRQRIAALLSAQSASQPAE